ncbi:ankyrin [Aspergillus fijiensis CBS 313.89]|uniref:Ankyrin n=1 Tax=Aspergillus fijiensis CBS 313.89 TaxID=1448319 RepID=A0A8G1RNU6_9EURO|nr:ankyrin [Aspergillus fijiensis CBS 313.89]RAK75220.1 ankyrin [Aspergillus fijiensis CBS 313.89]
MGSRNDDLPTNISLTGSDGPPGEPSVPEGDGTPSNGNIPEEGRALEADGVTGSDGFPAEEDKPADDDSPGKDDDLVHTDSVADVADDNDGPGEYRALEQERPRDLLQELIKAIEEGEPQSAEDLVTEHNNLANMTFTYGASKGSDISKERTTPLLLAIELSRSGLVELLVNRGADVNLTVMNAKDYEGEPETLKALKAAILCGSQVNLKDILEHSLNIINADISFTSEDVTGLTMEEITPSMLAVAFERPEITKLLKANGAYTEATTVNDESTPSLPVTIETQLRTIQHFRNRRATGSPLVNGNHTMAPLLAAAEIGNEKVFDILLKHKADPTASDIYGNTALHLASKGGDTTRSTSIPKGGYLAIIEGLVKKHPALVNQPNKNDETALIVAAMKDQKSIVELLIKFKANIESRDVWQYTALLNAATFQANSVIPTLLDAGANLAAKTGAGLNALQLACENNDEDTVRLLLGVPPIKLATLMRIGDPAKQTALGWAISEKTISERMDPSIIFQLLESSFFFPPDPAQDQVHCSPKNEQEPIAKWLLDYFRQQEMQGLDDFRRQEMLSHLVPVFSWGLVNAQNELCKVVMDKNLGSPPKLEDRCGATWLHVIASSGNVDGLGWMNDTWSAHLLTKASRGFTPLHAAVENRHEEMVRILLGMIDEKDASRVLDVILGEGKDAESAIAVAVLNNNEPEIEEQLWNKLRKLFEAKKLSASHGLRQDGDDAHRKDEWRNTAERVVGAAAWRYTTGEEKYLNGFMDIYLTGKARAKDMGPLDFVVNYRFPTALWWLLSSGEYFGEILFRKGNDLTKYGNGVDPADD